MTAASITTRGPARFDAVRLLRMLLPAIALSLMLAVIFSQQPRAMSYVGLTLLLNLAVPVILATLSQLCIIAINDLDLSIGSFVGLCACIAATLLKTPDLLILDEPTNGLDPAGIRDIRHMVRGLGESGVTVLLSSHNLAEVQQEAKAVVGAALGG